MNLRNPELPEFALDALERDDARADRDLAEAFGLLATAIEPVAPSAEARSRLLAAANAGSWRTLHEAMGRLFDLSAVAVRDLVRRARDATAWEPGPVANVELFHLQGGPRLLTADCGLVRLQPGTEFPHHRHVGTEVSLILEGTQLESSGRVLRAGDVYELDAGTEHSFRVSDDAPCVFAVVLSAGIDIPGIGKISTKK